MDKAAAVLIAAVSGRALAASARRAGYRPLVTDFFGDQDTLAVAQAYVRLPGNPARGMNGNAVEAALESLSERHDPIGIVCGTGFEARPRLLQRIARRWRLFGNGAGTVAKVKNPEILSSLCKEFGIPFPPWSHARPPTSANWLSKRVGGAGGVHVAPASRSKRGARATYYQRVVPGIPVSALFLSDGKHANVLGFTTQWPLPTAQRPYRYGGAVRPATLAPRTSVDLAAAVHRLAAVFALVGLNSADFMVDDDDYWLLEINPRPGATLDIFEPEGALFARHMAACAGRPVAPPPDPNGAKAAAIVYAEHDIAAVPALDWPDWTADRPIAGSVIKAGEPLCTVYACALAAAGARALVEERRKAILADMRARRQ